ncbi:MAG: hypothetical protein FWG43_05680 [Clostridiales bacterium]|nr:hypothetical protein [Clostridiales bacterium]
MPVSEKQISKKLKKQGYILCRTRAQHLADCVGGYMIVNAATLAIAAGPRFDLTLEDARAYVCFKSQQKAYA